MPSNDPSSMNVEPVGHSDIDGHGNGGQVSVAKLGGRHYAFVGHMLGRGTSILDVSDPGSPEVVAQIPIDGNTYSHKVRVCGDYILVNAEQLGGGGPSRPASGYMISGTPPIPRRSPSSRPGEGGPRQGLGFFQRRQFNDYLGALHGLRR